ncbi:hypothetical protein [Fretibacter rubidus]|uniref:hypothetical protein n=1 Tax=Fretibacter rubidus TaxID=570162 RepID=UPI00352B2FD7
MAHRATKLTLIMMTGLSLSACSTLSNIGQSVWNGTTQLTNTATRSVAAFFRPAPVQDTGGAYVFAGDDATLNTPRLAQRVATQPSAYKDNVVFSAAQSRVNTTPKLRGRYQSYNSYESKPLKTQSTPSMIPAITPEAAAPMQPSQTAQTGALSYVKIGGGSRMSDWTSCETKAGGYFNMTATGYTVEPAFDACMRDLGYLTEAEADAKFAQLEATQTNQRSNFAP